MSHMAHHPSLLSRLRITVAGQTREFADAVIALGRDTAVPVVVVRPRRVPPARGAPPRGWGLVPGGPPVHQQHFPRWAPGEPRTPPRGPAGPGPAGRHRRREVLVEVLPAPAAPPPQAPPHPGCRGPAAPAVPAGARGRCRVRCPARCQGRPRRPTSPRPGRRPSTAPRPTPRPATDSHRTRDPPYVEPVTMAAYGAAPVGTGSAPGAPAAAGPVRSRPHGAAPGPADRSGAHHRPDQGQRRRPRRPAGLPPARHPRTGQARGVARPEQLQRHFRQRPPGVGLAAAETGRRGDLRKPDVHVGRPPDDVPGHPPRPDPVRGEHDHGGEGRQAAARRGVVQPRTVVP